MGTAAGAVARAWPALAALARLRHRAGALDEARSLLERLVAADGGDKQHWIHLAVVCHAQRDEAREEEAIRQALVLDPADLLALILRAALYTRQGRKHAAARAHGAVAAVAPPIDRLAPQLRPALREALAYRERYDREFGGFRVGNDVRAWVEGWAWAFDDTIEHEAWNDSDRLRAILMFDIWHPHLTGAERALVTAMQAGMHAFSGEEGSFGL